MLKRFAIVLAAGIGAVVSMTAGAAVTSGSCEDTAVLLSPAAAEQTCAVTLVNAYNEDTGTYDQTNFVFYYKATLYRGKAYSFWLTGPDGRQADPWLIDFYSIDPREADPDKEEFEPGAMFQEFTGKWSPGCMQVMTEDEWYIDEDDPEMSDPASWVYYFQIAGTNAAHATLHYRQANALPLGIEDNPEIIVPTLTEKRTSSVKFVEGEFTYVFSVDPFLSGRRYLFATEGGTEANPYSLDFGAVGKTTPYTPWSTVNNAAFSFDPDSDGAGNIIATEGATNASAQVKLRYRMLPTRLLEEHNPEVLPLGEEGVRFTPGRINATDNQYYDTIIDQKLFKTVSLQKGTKYVIETNGSKTNLLMRVYANTFHPEYSSLTESQQQSRTGSPKYESTKKGDGSFDVRCGFTADYTGVYYIGVCQDLDDDDLDEPLADNEIQLTIEEIVAETGVPDVWDEADDTYAGATALTPVRGNKWAQPNMVDETGTAGWHQLGKTDWYDYFMIVGRVGLGYGIQASFDPESVTETSLTAEIYYLNGKSLTKVSKANGDINPTSDSGLFFAPDKNGVYYIRLRTSGSYGLDSPRYKMHAITYRDDELNSDHVGLLTVDQKGCDEAVWKLGSEATTYPYGITIALPIDTNKTSQAYTVKPVAVKNFNVTPTSETVTIVADDEPQSVFAVYSDKYDPKDDAESGAMAWTLASAAKTESRTLWTDDPVDNFALTGKDGYYFDFVLKQSDGGDASFSIVHDGETLVSGVSEVHQLALPTSKTKYYLKVAHKNADDPKDTSYTMTGFSKNVGALKFAKAAYSVKEGSASVAITVNRTAKEGKLRARLRTVDGDYAKGIVRGEAGDENSKFYKQDVILEWSDGDNKAKTVTIDLIPDIRPLYHDVVRAFTVELTDAKNDDDDYYPVSFVGGGEKAETTVTLTETAKKAPGTVQVANDDDKNVKKPTFTVQAGTMLTLALDRVSGSYGDISIACDTSAIDGKKPNLSWTDGNTDQKTVSVQIPEATDKKASVKYTIKLKVNTGNGLEKATLAASSVTVTALNQQFSQTLSDYTKNTLPKTCGYTIKEGKSGTWFTDADGAFISFDGSSALMFTVTGPAVLQYRVDDGELQTFVSSVAGKTATLTIPAGTYKVSDVKYLFNNGDFENVYQAVQYGYAEPISEDTAAKLKVAVGKLPDGIKLEQDKTSKKWYVRGVPTKAGYFFAEIQDAQKNVIGTNAFEVIALNSAIGTFNGVAKAEVAGAAALAQVTLTTATSGKLSAKANVNGKSVTMTATGFVRAEKVEGELRLTAELVQIQKAVTNVLECTLTDFATTDVEGWKTLPECRLTLGGAEETVYDGYLCRDNSKVTEWVTEMSALAGYYTAALVPEGETGFGNGYLTLTLDAKGKIKITGSRADGVTFSASSVVGGLDFSGDEPTVFVPVFAFKSPAVIGGWLALRFPTSGEAVTELPADGFFRWDGSGVSCAITPVGGYYDTVINLQRAYLTDEFGIESVEVPVSVIGDTVSVDKSNAANVKLTFKRATGLVSGTSDYTYLGKSYKNLKHSGVLLLNRSAAHASVLDENVWTAGSLVIPNLTNIPFNILYQPIITE